MRICFISQALPYLPSRDGFRLYGANLIRQFSKRHEIELISLLEEGDDDHLGWPRQYCRQVTTFRAANKSIVRRVANVSSGYLWGKPRTGRNEIASALRAGVAAGRWDVLHVEGAFIGGLVPPELPIGKVLSLHDSSALRCEEVSCSCHRPREKLYYAFLKHYEPRYERLVYPRFDFCTVVAQRDLEEVHKIVPDACMAVVPIGVDAEYFSPVSVEKERTSLIFHGNLSYAPNIEACMEFANDIWPLICQEIPAATFHVVGAQPGPQVKSLASRPRITVSADLVDLREAVCSAQVYVSAVHRGTGMKNKILEAMAMGIPVVCYPDSMIGIEAIPGQHLLIAHSHREFAAFVLQLLRNPDRAEKIAQAARRLVEEKYSWESRARTYEELYEQGRQSHQQKRTWLVSQ